MTNSNPEFDAAAIAAADLAAGRRLHRVYVTISMDFALDTRAVSGEAAWDTVKAPENRYLLAQRIQALPEEDLARIIALTGVVEELDEQSAQIRPVGTIYATNEDQGGKLVLPDQKSGPLS